MTHKFLRLVRMSAVFVVAMMALGARPGAAASIDWTFSFTLSNGDVGSGTFVTNSTPSAGPWLITAIDGRLSGSAMTLLPTETNSTFNDNLLLASRPFLDAKGLGFRADGFQWAIWTAPGGSSVNSWCNNANTGADHHCATTDPNGSVTRFSVTRVVANGAPVSEPATLALVGIGLLGLARVRRSRRT